MGKNYLISLEFITIVASIFMLLSSFSLITAQTTQSTSTPQIVSIQSYYTFLNNSLVPSYTVTSYEHTLQKSNSSLTPYQSASGSYTNGCGAYATLIQAPSQESQIYCNGMALTLIQVNSFNQSYYGIYVNGTEYSSVFINTPPVTANVVTFNGSIMQIGVKTVSYKYQQAYVIFNKIAVQPALSVGSSYVNITAVLLGGSVKLIGGTASGGSGTYYYQWWESTPGSTTGFRITGATTPTYIFKGFNTIGTYGFQLQASDSAGHSNDSNSVRVTAFDSTSTTSSTSSTSSTTSTTSTTSISTTTVNPLNVEISPENPTITAGQSVTFSATWNGTNYPYHLILLSSSTSTCNLQSTQLSTATVNLKDSSGGFSFNPVTPSANTYYCIAVNGQGSTAYNSSNFSPVSYVRVNTATTSSYNTSINIKINKGWNLLSLPMSVNGTYSTIFNTLSNACGSTTLYGIEGNSYININQQNASYYFIRYMNSGHNADYLASGFWLYSNNPCEIPIKAFNFTNYAYKGAWFNETLAEGWNIVGVPFIEPYNYNGIVNNCNILSGPYGYGPGPGYDEYQKTQNFIPGDGYMIDVQNTCNFKWNIGNTGNFGVPIAAP